MASPTLRVDGGRELRRALKQAQVDLQNLRDVHAQAGRIVEQRAERDAPVGSGRSGQPGRLKGSLRSSGTQSAAIVRAGKKLVPYAGPVHWGWPVRRIPENPFIYNAAQETHAAWEDVYLAGVNRILDKVGTTS